jgi:hypothetical protein
MFPFYGRKCLSGKTVHNWTEKFSQEGSKVADDARPSRSVDTATETTVRWVEQLIRADRRITIGSVTSALGCSHGLAYSIMYDHLKFRKVCARLLGKIHGCITANPHQSVFQCNANNPVDLQPKSLRLQVRHQLGRLRLPCFGILREYC